MISYIGCTKRFRIHSYSHRLRSDVARDRDDTGSRRFNPGVHFCFQGNQLDFDGLEYLHFCKVLSISANDIPNSKATFWAK